MDRSYILRPSAVVALVLAAAPVHADSGQGAVKGLVRDANNGNAIAGAAVLVRHDRGQLQEVAMTDPDGHYHVSNIAPGDYEIIVTTFGYQTRRVRGIHIQADAVIRVDMGLLADGEPLSHTIVVPAPVVDIGSNSAGIHIDKEMARRVPIAAPGGKGAANRSFEAIAEAMPGAQLDAYGASIGGTTSPENLYRIDGLSVGNAGYGIIGIPLSVEFLEEVQVESGGRTAESGRSTGGALHAVTKSGADKFFGSVWMNVVPGGLEGIRTPPRREAAAIALEQRLRWQGDTGFDLGGYLVKGRLWFYTGLQVARTVHDMRTTWHQTVVDPESGEVLVDANTGFSRTTRIPNSTTVLRAQGTALQIPLKLTARVRANHRLELFALYAPSMAGGNGTYGLNQWTGQPEIADGLGTFESRAHRYETQASNVQVKWAASSDDKNWRFDTMIGWHHQVDKTLASDGGSLGSQGGLAGVPHVTWRRNSNPGFHSATDFLPLPAGADPDTCVPVAGTPTCPVTSFTTGGARRGENHFERVHARSVATRHVRGLGHHVIKFGFDVEYAQYRDVRALSGGGYYRESLNGMNFRIEQLGTLVGPDQPLIFNKLDRTTSSSTIGGFVQDSWAIKDRVTLNVGVRYDVQHLFNAERDLTLALPNQLSPLAGVVWDPTRAGRAKIFASYGRAYQNIPLALANRAGLGNPVIYSFAEAGPGRCDPSDPRSRETICQAEDGRLVIGGPSAPDQLWLVTSSTKSLVDPGIRPQSRDEVLVGGELEVISNARLGATYHRHWLNRAVEDMSRDEGQTFFIGNPGHGLAASDFPRAQRVYDSATFFFSRRFLRGWGLEASYTLSWLRGNIAGLYRPETGQLQPNLNSDFDLVSQLRNRTGWLAADHRHNVKVFGAGEVPIGTRSAILLGMGFRALSGGPTNALAGQSLYGPNESFLIQRGAGPRLPWQFRVDSRLGYGLNLRNKMTVSVTISVYNVANFQAATAIDQAYTFNNVLPSRAGSIAELGRMMLTDTTGGPVAKNPNFGNTTAYQMPRQFQFELRLDF